MTTARQREETIAALLGRAVAAHNAGDTADAERLYRDILELDPLNADAHHLLGVLALSRGETDRAIAHIGTALSLSPDQAVALNNLGNCYLARDEHAVAELCFRRALDLDPAYADAGNNLGWVLSQHKRDAEAVPILERVIALVPSHEPALCNLARIRYDSGRSEDALDGYERVLAFNPRSGSALVGKMGCLFELRRLEEGMAVADRIPALAPDRALAALTRKGEMLETLGRIDEARALYDRALATAPTDVDLLYARSRNRKIDAREPYFAQLMSAAPMLDGLPGPAKAKLAYALGKAHEDTGAIDRAADYYARGAAIIATSRPYDEEVETRFVSAIAERCTRGYLDGLPRSKARGTPAIIFIAGMPRSGTTLVEQILASHPDVVPLGEIGVLPRALENYLLPGGSLINATPDSAFSLESSLQQRAEYYRATIRARTEARDERCATDKTLANYLYLGLIPVMFPDARIIHCRRDPIDTCISNYTMLYNDTLDWTYALDRLGRHFRRYWTLMAHWRRTMPGGFLEIRYEQMVGDQRATTARLLDWCGLDWDDQVLKFHQTAGRVKTASLTQVRQPIYTSSMGRWQKWEPHIGPLLAEIRDLHDDYWREIDA